MVGPITGLPITITVVAVVSSVSIVPGVAGLSRVPWVTLLARVPIVPVIAPVPPVATVSPVAVIAVIAPIAPVPPVASVASVPSVAVFPVIAIIAISATPLVFFAAVVLRAVERNFSRILFLLASLVVYKIIKNRSRMAVTVHDTQHLEALGVRNFLGIARVRHRFILIVL